MSRLLLDSTYLVASERAGDDVEVAIHDDDDVAIAAISVAELRVGVLLASTARRRARESWVNQVLNTLPVIDYDVEVANAHAELLVHVRRQGTPRGAHDLIIAATALASGRIVVTADRSAFADLPGVQTVPH